MRATRFFSSQWHATWLSVILLPATHGLGKRSARTVPSNPSSSQSKWRPNCLQRQTQRPISMRQIRESTLAAFGDRPSFRLDNSQSTCFPAVSCGSSSIDIFISLAAFNERYTMRVRAFRQTKKVCLDRVCAARRGGHVDGWHRFFAPRLRSFPFHSRVRPCVWVRRRGASFQRDDSDSHLNRQKRGAKEKKERGSRCIPLS